MEKESRPSVTSSELKHFLFQILLILLQCTSILQLIQTAWEYTVV